MLGTTSIRTVSSSGNADVDALLVGKRWSGFDFFSQAVELWYAFPSRKVSFTDYGSNEDLGELESFSAVTAAQQTAIRAAFSLISSYTLVTFRQDPFYHPTMTANDTTRSELLFGRTDATDTAHAYSTDADDTKSGDVWFNRSSGLYDSPVQGDYAFTTVLHEIGHAIGLKHPHEAETFGAMSLALDNMNYTLMSYRSYEGMAVDAGFANETFGFAQTYMMYDIAALQHMYGANFSANGWDNVYRWDPVTGAATNNGAAWVTPGANRVFMTVWDGGGIDTYDLSAYADAVEIDLNPGAWTQTSAVQLANLGDGHYAEGNIANALLYKGDPRSLIENAIGGAGDDVLVGNQAANALTGNDGNDRIDGALGNDTLDGGAGHDRLDGGTGADLMRGGTGNDRYFVDNAGDVIVELGGAGDDDVDTSLAVYVLPDHVETLIGTSTTFAHHLTGNSLANLIGIDNGGVGGNVLDGRGGADRMIGTAFDDTYHVDNVGDFIEDFLGNDTVVSRISHTLIDYLENLTLDGTAAIDGTGSYLANVIVGNVAANRLSGAAGDDVIDGGAGNDRIEGGAGLDRLSGGLGDDLFVVDALDVVAEAAGEGTDTIEAGFSYVLGANIENLVLTGDAVAGTGNDLANILTGNGANNVLDGRSGADVMRGGAGNDSYVVDNAGDVVTEAAGGGTDVVNSAVSHALGANVENLILTGSAAIDATGNALANSLTGNAAANRLDGGLGADTMTGGLGDDVYAVDHAGDRIVELAGGGADTVESVISYTLAADLEHLTLAGTAAIAGTGNAAANVLTGNAAANTLNGGAGADVMRGGAGDDIYLVDAEGDQAEETASGHGKDLVRSSISFTLGAFVEKLSLNGTDAIDGTGNALGNSILGNAAANRLDGGTGADAMAGGAGDDIYIVDHIGDRATESSAGDGIDTVMSSVAFSLTAHVENLVLTGAGSIGATGNSIANAIAGNAAANLINGGGGADSMVGAGGNDIYIVDHAGDVVTELAGEGMDLVKSTVTFILGDNVERLTLRGSAAIDGIGNALANTIAGNEAANRLDGAAGADKLLGAGGNDIYIVDNVADQAIETSSGGGTDRVESSVTFTLGDHVEQLTLTGAAAVNGIGNALANLIAGNSGANILDGGRGNDSLVGGGGDDRLVGGLGNDSLRGDAGADDFVFDKPLGPTNVDRILDFAAGADAILLENSIFKGLAAGALGASALRVGAAAADADDRIVYDPATGNLYYDADGIGAAAQVLFATLDTRPMLTASDFAVI